MKRDEVRLFYPHSAPICHASPLDISATQLVLPAPVRDRVPPRSLNSFKKTVAILCFKRFFDISHHITSLIVNSDKGVGEGIEDNWNAGREHLQHLGKILKWMQAGVGDNSGFPLPPISLLTHIPTHLLSSALLYRLLKLL